MLLFEGTRKECHAFLDGLLDPPDQDYSALTTEEATAYEAGLVLRGQHPLADCRETSEPGTGRLLFRVVEGADG
jgi:hypothetical protein